MAMVNGSPVALSSGLKHPFSSHHWYRRSSVAPCSKFLGRSAWFAPGLTTAAEADASVPVDATIVRRLTMGAAMAAVGRGIATAAVDHLSPPLTHDDDDEGKSLYEDDDEEEEELVARPRATAARENAAAWLIAAGRSTTVMKDRMIVGRACVVCFFLFSRTGAVDSLLVRTTTCPLRYSDGQTVRTAGRALRCRPPLGKSTRDSRALAQSAEGQIPAATVRLDLLRVARDARVKW